MQRDPDVVLASPESRARYARRSAVAALRAVRDEPPPRRRHDARAATRSARSARRRDRSRACCIPARCADVTPSPLDDARRRAPRRRRRRRHARHDEASARRRAARPARPGLARRDVAVVRTLRLPRVVLAMLVGAGLGAAGAALQGATRNGLAEPYLLGVSGGAAVGAVVAVALHAPPAARPGRRVRRRARRDRAHARRRARRGRAGRRARRPHGRRRRRCIRQRGHHGRARERAGQRRARRALVDDGLRQRRELAAGAARRALGRRRHRSCCSPSRARSTCSRSARTPRRDSACASRASRSRCTSPPRCSPPAPSRRRASSASSGCSCRISCASPARARIARSSARAALAGASLVVAADLIARVARPPGRAAARRRHGAHRRALLPHSTAEARVIAFARRERALSRRAHARASTTCRSTRRAVALTAVVGPNGSGKSTLVRALIGQVPLEAGSIDDRRRAGARSRARRTLARRVAVVTQREEPAFPLGVREYVALGRYPHLGLLRGAGDGRHRRDRARGRAHGDRAVPRPRDHRALRRRVAARSSRARARAGRRGARARRAHDLPRRRPRDGRLRAARTARRRRAGRAAREPSAQPRRALRRITWCCCISGRVVAAGAPADVMQGSVLERVYDWPLVVTRDPAVGAPALVPLRARPRG